MVILLVSTFPVRCLLVLVEGSFSTTTALFLNICFIFCPSKTSLTCCREASTQSDDSRWGWCVLGHVVCLLSLKTPRLTLKILQFEQIPESSSSLPLHLSHIFKCTFLVIQNLNPEAPLRLSQWSFRTCTGVSAALVSLSIHLQMIHLQSQGKKNNRLDVCFLLIL